MSVRRSSFRGVPLTVVSVRDQFGHVLDVREMPNRNGNDIDDRALKGEVYTLHCVWHGETWQDDYERFARAVAQLGPGELVHPLWGRRNVVVETADSSYDLSRAADGCEGDLTVRVHTDAPSIGPFEDADAVGAVVATRAAAVNVSEAATALETPAALAATTQPTQALNAVSVARTAADEATSAADAIEAMVDTVNASVAEVGAAIDSATHAVDLATATIANYTTALEHNLASALVELRVRLQRLGQRVIAPLNVAREEVLQEELSLLEIAHRFLGDSSRAAELLARNIIPDPMLVPAGTRLVIHG